MHTQKFKNLFTFPTATLLLAGLSMAGCDSDNNSAELARAVSLEQQRANGTIIEEVTIVGDHIRLKAGKSIQLRASGLDSNGDTSDVTNKVTWTSADTTIATVNSQGLVKAVAPSTINQGIVTITATADSGMYDDGEISVSDVAVSNITLNLPATDSITACIDTNITANVGYDDNYIALNTTKDISFDINSNTSAKINSEGTFYSSASDIENSTITAKTADITGKLTITSDPKNIDSIDILHKDEATQLIILDVGERIQVNGSANLAPEVSKDKFVIDNAISWSQEDSSFAGITKQGDNKGTILALKSGVTQLFGRCGGKEAIATIQVKGDSELDSIQINGDENTITLEPNQSVDLELTAKYATIPSINVSEFAQWSINDNLLKYEFVNTGTDKALYRVTSKSSKSSTAIVSVTYEGLSKIIEINVE